MALPDRLIQGVSRLGYLKYGGPCRNQTCSLTIKSRVLRLVELIALN